jgi:serine/threonine-protein kinase
VIHRDIKPENILISNGLPVVADFGIARAVGLAGGATLTGVGFPIGTAAYMSPEQATAASPVGMLPGWYGAGGIVVEGACRRGLNPPAGGNKSAGGLIK